MREMTLQKEDLVRMVHTLTQRKRVVGSDEAPTIPDRRRQCFGSGRGSISSSPDVRTHVPILAGIDVEMPITKNLSSQMDRASLPCSPVPQFTPSTFGATAATPRVESSVTSSDAPHSSQYAFIPTNFAKLVKKVDKHEKQMKMFIKWFGTFLVRAIAAALEQYVSLHLELMICRKG
ncbi:hypothetical protein HAX54_017387 [Datura stramonium]|uniref:Uncharacterized protein n=1 Tax=Datura stramonium TaxID=4076 RepID=A0ABS8S0N4_DATST|nr:hypothetical protein [Datura stramonium]